MTTTDVEHVEAETGTPERTTSVDGEPTTTTETAPKVKAAKKFPVIELFGPVIQGEGSQAGQQTMFVRFGGCDFRCEKCDSMHAVEPQAIQKHARYLTAEEIHEELDAIRLKTGVEWVTFSGGNPAMHKLDELVIKLKEDGWYINVETQGSLFQPWLRYCHMVTVSPKPPGMGESFNVEDFLYFLQQLGPRPICIKVPVFYEIDLEMALRVQDAVDYAFGYTSDPVNYPPVAFYMSLGNPFPPRLNRAMDLEFDEPEGGLTRYLLQAYRRMSEEVLQDRRFKRWRFLPQLHVLVYGNETGR